MRERYQEAIDCGQYRRRIEKLLDTYLVADEVTPITDLINIFDEDAFVGMAQSPASASSRADAIAHATAKAINEHWDEDPAFYKRFSELIKQAIDDFRAKRISDLEYLNRVRDVRDQVVNPDNSGLPEGVRDDPLARAFYGCVAETFEAAGGSATPERSAEAARYIVDTFTRHRRVDWAGSVEVENAIRNDIDDYIFDVMRGEHGIDIPTDAVDALVERLLAIARRQAA